MIKTETYNVRMNSGTRLLIGNLPYSVLPTRRGTQKRMLAAIQAALTLRGACRFWCLDVQVFAAATKMCRASGSYSAHCFADDSTW